MENTLFTWSLSPKGLMQWTLLRRLPRVGIKKPTRTVIRRWPIFHLSRGRENIRSSQA